MARLKIPAVRRLGKLFEDAGHEIRIVGGWVRDTIRNVPPKDLDLATTATPEQMIELCRAHDLRFIETGLQHGTITVVFEDVPHEITTLRVDAETDGRHARVEFTTDWELDAARRDFTINAMSVGMNGELFDYFNGRAHAVDNRVVFVGEPQDRIQEDYLRILRYFRFRARIGDQVNDRPVIQTIAANAHGLQQISGERIWAEMSKILASPEPQLCVALTDMFYGEIYPNISLPKTEWREIVHTSIVRQTTDNPITVLAALTNVNLGPIWHFSSRETILLRWLQARYYPASSRPTLAELKAIAVSKKGREFALALASMYGVSDELDQITAWEVPEFPVNGDDLINRAIAKPGPALGKVLSTMHDAWKASDYTLTKNQLLDWCPLCQDFASKCSCLAEGWLK